MISKIGSVMVFVENQEEAKNFWIEKMGFSVSFEKQIEHGFTWLEVAPSENAGTAFALCSKRSIKGHSPSSSVENTTIFLDTTDINAAHSKMQENGIEVGNIMPMIGTGQKLFQFKDTEGNSFMLREV